MIDGKLPSVPIKNLVNFIIAPHSSVLGHLLLLYLALLGFFLGACVRSLWHFIGGVGDHLTRADLADVLVERPQYLEIQGVGHLLHALVVFLHLHHEVHPVVPCVLDAPLQLKF